MSSLRRDVYPLLANVTITVRRKQLLEICNLLLQLTARVSLTDQDSVLRQLYDLNNRCVFGTLLKILVLRQRDMMRIVN